MLLPNRGPRDAKPIRTGDVSESRNGQNLMPTAAPRQHRQPPDGIREELNREARNTIRPLRRSLQAGCPTIAPRGDATSAAEASEGIVLAGWNELEWTETSQS